MKKGFKLLEKKSLEKGLAMIHMRYLKPTHISFLSWWKN